MTLKELILKELFRSRAMVTWLILVAATVVSPFISAEGGGRLAAVAVLAVATIKIRLIALDFMELRHAPWGMRVAIEGFCVAMWAVLSGLYLWL